MQINISLPRPVEAEMTTESTRHFLRQLELSVHHAQKSLDEMVKMQKEAGKEREVAITYRLADVSDSGTGERFESEHPSTDDIEIELYEA